MNNSIEADEHFCNISEELSLKLMENSLDYIFMSGAMNRSEFPFIVGVYSYIIDV